MRKKNRDRFQAGIRVGQAQAFGYLDVLLQQSFKSHGAILPQQVTLNDVVLERLIHIHANLRVGHF